MAWYQNGTVGVTNGSPTVVGTTTLWVANADVGQSFYGPDFREYEITNITDDTHLTISPAYQGSTVASGAAYKIIPVQGYLRTTAAALAALVTTASAFFNLTPSDKDIIQYNSGAWTTRSPLQQVLDHTNAITEQSIASAGTTNIGTVTTPKVQVTGTTTITSFGSTPNCLRFVRFGGALTLTQNAASLILPYGLDMTTNVGDTAIFMSDASGNWRCMAYNYVSLSTTLSANSAATETLKNISTGVAARAAFALGNSGANLGQLWHNGASFTTSGMARADGTALTSNGSGGLSIYTTAAQPLYLGYNSVQVAQIVASGLEVQSTNKNLSDGLNGDAEVAIAAMTTDAFGADVGAAIGMGGNYSGTPNKQLFAAITGRKASSTNGDAEGYMGFWVNNNTSLVEVLRLTTMGRNAPATLQITNTFAGTAATAEYKLTNGTSISTLKLLGNSYTDSGIFKHDATMLLAAGVNGLVIGTSVNQLMTVAINNTAMATFGSLGATFQGLTAFGQTGRAVSKSASASASGGTVDLDTGAGANGWSGLLIVANTSQVNASNRSHQLVAVVSRGAVFHPSGIFAQSDGAGCAFTLSCPSAGVIRVTNNDAGLSAVDVSYFWNISF